MDFQMRLTLLTLAFATLAFPTLLAAETRQHGNVIFDLPKGWAIGAVQDDGTLTLRSDLPGEECEYCTIYITPGTRTAGRADTWLGQQTRRFIDPDESPEITVLAQPEIFSLKGRPAAMLGQKVDDDLQMLAAVQLFGRMELMAFKAPAYDEAGAAEGMAVFQRDVIPMIEGARFVSEGAAPLMPAPQPGPLSGVWWGTSTWWSMGLDGMMTMEIDHHWLTFWPDGRFYDGTPPAGTAPFDPASLLDAGDMDWGSYVVEGKTLTLSYASGAVQTYDVQNDAFTLGDRTLHGIEPMADGTKLDGIVSTIFVSGFTPGIGMSGGMTAMTDTRYNPDGTWEFGSYTGASSTFDNGTGFSTGSERSERGRYEVKDGLVILYAEDGSVTRSRYIFKAGTTIWIGSDMLE
jgi:hypothetical protein